MRAPVRSELDAAAQPSTILFLAANPASDVRIRIDEECREIEKKIGTARFGERLRFRSRWAVRPDDLLCALLEDEPSALHFGGHGAGEKGLCFQSDDGSAVSITASMLNEVMCAADDRLKVVVLNACHSNVQASAIIDHVPCVIGAPHAITDSAAIAYSGAFYRALAYAHSVADAHQHGLAALAMATTVGITRDIDEAKAAIHRPTPVLLTRPGFDAKKVYLLAGADCPTVVFARAQVHIELTIERDFDSLDISTLAEMMCGIRQLTQGRRVKIVCISEGSVRLVVALCPEDAARLTELRRNGQFTRLCGSTISSMIEVARVDGSIEVNEKPSNQTGTHAASKTKATDKRDHNPKSTSGSKIRGAPQLPQYRGRLLWRDAQGVEGSLDLTSAEIRIGRAMDCAIRTDDAMVSRHHSRVFVGDDGYVLEDLSSANGVYFQEQRVQSHVLKHGDAVRCGSLWLRFVDGPAREGSAVAAGQVSGFAVGTGHVAAKPPAEFPAASEVVRVAPPAPPPTIAVAATLTETDVEIRVLRRRIEQLQSELRVYRTNKFNQDTARRMEDLENNLSLIEIERDRLRAKLTAATTEASALTNLTTELVRRLRALCE